LTDVQVTIEGCDHVMTPAEAEAKARELLELAEQARTADLQPTQLTIERGLITEQQIGDILAEFYPRDSRKWGINHANLWRKIQWFWVFQRPPYSRDGELRTYTFTVTCFHCGVPHHQCRQRHWCLAVPVNELFENAYYFKLGNYNNIVMNYDRVLDRVKVLTAA
jgi:hypothetical protein